MWHHKKGKKTHHHKGSKPEAGSVKKVIKPHKHEIHHHKKHKLL